MPLHSLNSSRLNNALSKLKHKPKFRHKFRRKFRRKSSSKLPLLTVEELVTNRRDELTTTSIQLLHPSKPLNVRLVT